MILHVYSTTRTQGAKKKKVDRRSRQSNRLTDSMEHKPSWGAYSFLASHLTPVFMEPKVMRDWTSANPGSPCCITSRETDSHQCNTVIPPAQHSFIPPPPSTTCCASSRPVRSLYFLLALPLPCHIPSEYKYTDTSQPDLFFLHLPRKMEPIEGSKRRLLNLRRRGNTQKKTY